jgi:hypothetical protein
LQLAKTLTAVFGMVRNNSSSVLKTAVFAVFKTGPWAVREASNRLEMKR